MKVAIVGASGYGNIGDDTYPLIFTRAFADHELVFFNSDIPEQLPQDIGLLILGGGGLLHNVGPKSQGGVSHHFRCMQFYMDAAIRRGIPWGISSCGFQFGRPLKEADLTEFEPWIHYLRQAHFITLRSPSCVEIAKMLTGRKDLLFFPDLAYLHDLWAMPDLNTKNRVVVVPAGEVSPEDQQTKHHLYQLLSSKMLITWLSMGAALDDGLSLEKATQHFPETQVLTGTGPAGALNIIASARLVITGRYHGMVFARSCGVPYITPMNVPYKIEVEDLTVDIQAAVGHLDVLRSFLAS